jgi:aspartate beta-hydroxylase
LLVDSNAVASVMDDAWMELTLSMEEISSDRIVARHTGKMAIVTHSCGWVDPLQRPGYMTTTSLDGIPFIPCEKHPPWCKAIEANFEQILKEYKSLTNHNPHDWHVVGSGQRGSGHTDNRVVSGKSWTEYVLFGRGCSDSDNDAPITKQLLRQHVPDAVSLAEMGGGEVIFSRLEGGTTIQAHCGPTNIRWTAHLGLVVPKSESKCQIRVADEWHSWEPGQMLLFDDSFEHEVINLTNEERVVLLLRLWHPQLDPSWRNDVLLDAMSKKEENVEKRIHPPE